MIITLFLWINSIWLTSVFAVQSALENQVLEEKDKAQRLQTELDVSEQVQKDFVKLSQTLQVKINKNELLKEIVTIYCAIRNMWLNSRKLNCMFAYKEGTFFSDFLSSILTIRKLIFLGRHFYTVFTTKMNPFF